MSSTSIAPPISTSTSSPASPRHANPIIAFIIGLSIILLASVLNAAGLNLTKLDHVCSTRLYLMLLSLLTIFRLELAQYQNLPGEKIGCALSGFSECFCICAFSYFTRYPFTLSALQFITANRKHSGFGIYARWSVYLQLLSNVYVFITTGIWYTEYVAPLGSTSLVFNFLFARFLVGTPVTSTDIYVRVCLTIQYLFIITRFIGYRCGHSRCYWYRSLRVH